MTADEQTIGTSPRPESPRRWNSSDVEKLARRGDCVLFIAVALVAFCFGCTEIYDARSLVHVRSGEWMSAHHFLPAEFDPFSITAADRRWINLSWGFDLVSLAVFQAGGATAASLLQGLAACLIATGLHFCARSDVRRWGIALAIALVFLVIYRHLTWRPELVTLLGVIWLLWWLTRVQLYSRLQPLLWSIPPGLWLWSQLDPRAWMGVLIVAIFWIGQGLGSRCWGSSLTKPHLAFGPVLLVSLPLMAIHPFGWETYFSPWRLFAIEYPALREAFPHPWGDDLDAYSLLSPHVWAQLDDQLVAGVLLQMVALGCLWLNRARSGPTEWLLYLVFNGLACLTLHEMPVAGLINCYLAGTQGQDWYVHQYGQIYSTRWQDLAFSLGGRAVTLVGFAGLGILTVSDELNSQEPHHFGTGIACSLQDQLDDFSQLASSTPDDRGFHFTLRQGNAMIASGRRSFVDHRVQLFVAQPDHPEDLLERHDQIRRQLRRLPETASTADAGAGKAMTPAPRQMLERYEISHLLPRLTQHRKPPDYVTFLMLLGSRTWTLSKLCPTVAVFLRTEGPQGRINAYGKSHRLNVLQTGFRNVITEPIPPRERIVVSAWQGNSDANARECPSQGTQVAQHWLRLEHEIPTAPISFQVGACLSAVRFAQAGVNETPRSAIGYRTLGAIYAHLLRLESAVLADERINWGRSLRYYQAVAPLRQAALLAPDDPAVHLLLFELSQAAGYADVTHEALSKFLTLTGDGPSHLIHETQLAPAIQMQQRLAQMISKMADRVQTALAASDDRGELADECHRNGCLNLAIEILEADPGYLARNPSALWRLTAWRAERGDGEPLDHDARRLTEVSRHLNSARWREAVAYAALGRADYSEAIRLWNDEQREINQQRAAMLIAGGPLAILAVNDPLTSHVPLNQLHRLHQAARQNSELASSLGWQKFICHLEAGNCRQARIELENALRDSNSSPLRPLLRLYWYCLTDELIESQEEIRIPDVHDLFTPEPDSR